MRCCHNATPLHKRNRNNPTLRGTAEIDEFPVLTVFGRCRLRTSGLYLDGLFRPLFAVSRHRLLQVSHEFHHSP